MLAVFNKLQIGVNMSKVWAGGQSVGWGGGMWALGHAFGQAGIWTGIPVGSRAVMRLSGQWVGRRVGGRSGRRVSDICIMSVQSQSDIFQTQKMQKLEIILNPKIV